MRTVKFFRYIIISVIIFFIVISASGAYYQPVTEETSAETSGIRTVTVRNISRSWIYYKYTSAAAEYENTGWAEIYFEYLSAAEVEGEDITGEEIFCIGKFPFRGLALIYVNDDDIPELVLYGAYHLGPSFILTIDRSGEVDVLQTERPGFSYEEKRNILNNCDGHHGYFYDIFYRINEEGKWELAAECYNGDPSGYGNPEDYIYTCDGVYITEEEYNELCESYINPDTEIRYYDIDYLNLEEMRVLLLKSGSSWHMSILKYILINGL